MRICRSIHEMMLCYFSVLAMDVDENNTFGPSEATRLRYEGKKMTHVKSNRCDF